MTVLVFRHVPFEDLGRIAPALERAGADVEHVDLFRDPGRAVDANQAAGLVFMGGPMSANDELPYIRRELDKLLPQPAGAAVRS